MLEIRINYKIDFCLFSFILLHYDIAGPGFDAQLFNENCEQYKIIVLDFERSLCSMYLLFVLKWFFSILMTVFKVEKILRILLLWILF